MKYHSLCAAAAAVLFFVTGGAAQSTDDVLFTCEDGRSIIANFSSDTAHVTMTMSLDAKPAGSGFLYEGPSASSMRGKGDEMMWTDASNSPTNCTVVPGGADLVGQTWELLKVSPAASGGEWVEAKDPSRHTLTFHADGLLSIGADCNRGQSNWQVTPDENEGAAMAIGDTALTRALCPDDPFANMVADLAQVVSYSVAQNQLTLTLSDENVYVFQPMGQ